MKNKRLLKGIVCVFSAAVMTACGTVEKIIETDTETVFRHYYTAECTTLDYLSTTMYADTAVIANVIDCLIDYDDLGNIVPGLAESWSHNEDMTEWTFNLRKGVKWVNSVGAEYCEVKADDWVAAAEYVNNAFNESMGQYMYDSGSVIRGAEEYFEYTKYLKESDNGRLPNDKDGHPFIVPPEAKAEDIGVHALDDYTLVYELESPCPFFLSIISVPSYMPVCRKFLEAEGEMFGQDNKHLLYNGAYVLSVWSPLETHVLTKNASYWDKDKVYIDRIEETYNQDAYKVQAEMYLKGQVDEAQLDTEELAEWMDDRERREMVHPARSDNSYSYFYCFNFDPQFSDWYERENWRLAVNNENFRKAVSMALDKRALVKIYDPYDPDRLVSNTVTPRDFASVGGVDYTMQEQLKGITEGDTHDIYAAKLYSEKARSELGQVNTKFPIKMLVPYNPTALGADTEARMVEQQIEETLGRDFIDVIVEPGPETNYLLDVRRSGNYAFMKCNWGGDYVDPETFAEPFTPECEYCFWHKGTTDTAFIYNEWNKLRREAISPPTPRQGTRASPTRKSCLSTTP